MGFSLPEAVEEKEKTNKPKSEHTMQKLDDVGLSSLRTLLVVEPFANFSTPQRTF